MRKYNTKAIIVALLVLLAGFALTVFDIFWFNTASKVWISIGCSLVASALVILLNTFLVDATISNPLDDWKLRRIVTTRAEINNECAEKLRRAKHQVDIVAFGLQSFRNKQSNAIEGYLKKGVSFRILTMDPSSSFVVQREKEEDDTNIKNSIDKLIEWADKLNEKQYKGRIIIKGYSCMTLDFYWRVDHTIYVGPYWVGYDSQQTVTYAYDEGGEGFKLYAEYFEKLWNTRGISTYLTKETKVRQNKNKTMTS